MLTCPFLIIPGTGSPELSWKTAVKWVAIMLLLSTTTTKVLIIVTLHKVTGALYISD